MDNKWKKLLLIYNAKAGIGNQNIDFIDALELLAKNYYEVTVYPICPEYGITSESILERTGKKFNLAMICGGDGTLNHAVNGLLKNQIKMPIGYLPVGSTNDFSKSLYGKGNHSIIDVCQWIMNGKTFCFDSGKFNERYFNYVAGFGDFPMVSFTTPQNLKNTFGYAAYILNFLGSIPDGLSYCKHCHIVHDGIEEDGDFMFGLFTNSIQVAGMQPGLIKSSSLNDGVFEATLVRANLNPIEIADTLHALNSNDPNSDHVITFEFKNATFQFDDAVPWTLDGEDGGITDHVEINVIPHAVNVFVPDGEE